MPWRRWGPFLSERQWGTVREDYSGNGDAWSYFTHDQARSRAYRRMSGWPAQPVIYEINTLIWLGELGRRYCRMITLDSVPAEDWDEAVPSGVDAVWLMGVWERSPEGLRIALNNPELQESFRQALPDLGPGDIAGSPYCVRNYAVDQILGGPRRAGGGTRRTRPPTRRTRRRRPPRLPPPAAHRRPRQPHARRAVATGLLR